MGTTSFKLALLCLLQTHQIGLASSPKQTTTPTALSRTSKIRLELVAQRFLQEVGGPQQYLLAAMNVLDRKNEFASWLVKTTLDQDDASHVHSEVVPLVEESSRAATLPSCVHVAALGLDKKCSVKPTLFLSTSKELLDGYLKTVSSQVAMSYLLYSLAISSARGWRRSGTAVLTELSLHSRCAT